MRRINRELRKLLHIHHRRNVLSFLLTLVSCAVFLFVQVSLSLPGEALTAEPICGIEEHIHNEDCFDEEGNLICEIEEHVHTEDCYKVWFGELFAVVKSDYLPVTASDSTTVVKLFAVA